MVSDLKQYNLSGTWREQLDWSTSPYPRSVIGAQQQIDGWCVCVCVCGWMGGRAGMRAFIYMYVYICVCVYIHMCIYMYIYIRRPM